MMTLQHSLITLFANNGNEQELEKEIPLYIEPDIIPVEETSTIYIQKTDELDNNIKMILEKYDNIKV